MRINTKGAAACGRLWATIFTKTRTSCLNQGMPYLHCRILTAIDVDCLLGAGLCYDDLGVVNMVLHHPLALWLTHCPPWLCSTCCSTC